MSMYFIIGVFARACVILLKEVTAHYMYSDG